MSFNPTNLLVCLVLSQIQFLAAVPWLYLFFRTPHGRPPAGLVARGMTGAFLCVLFPILAFLGLVERSYLETGGLAYTLVLQFQLAIDFFILFFFVLLRLWPKGGAVAQAAFREGVRQPMFWLLLGFGFVALSVSPFIPYFTFGEDHIMVKELGYDTLMLVATVFGALAASISITEEIEGRTAVTLMSKPVSRRQFLLGKYIGILLAAGLMFALLGSYFEGVLLYKAWWDRVDPVPLPTWISSLLSSLDLPTDTSDLLRGIALWVDHTIDTLPGLILSFCQVMVLLAVAVTLAVRVPMVVNLCTVLAVYFFAHLTPNLVAIGKKAVATDSTSAVGQVLSFMSQVFDTLLPALNFFRISPALMGDTPPPTGPFYLYVGSVAMYGLLYTFIVLLFGLILFEDRDLA
jgi:hypothetical protein